MATRCFGVQFVVLNIGLAALKSSATVVVGFGVSRCGGIPLHPAPVVDSVTDDFHSVHQSNQYFELSICENRRLFVSPSCLKERTT